MSTKRISNFELLRIVAIFFIIFSHFCVHGIGEQNTSFSINGFITSFFSLGNIGVVIFMMISGFFLAYSNKVKWNKVLILFTTYYFYLISLYLVSLILENNKFNITEFLQVIGGFIFGRSWFVPMYLLVYIFHPFINKIFNYSTYKEKVIFILLITLFWSLISMIPNNEIGYNNLISIFCCYSYGAFLKYSSVEQTSKWYKKNVSILMIVVSLILLILSILCIGIISMKKPELYKFSNFFYSRNSILVLMFSSGLIMLTSLSKSFYFRPINFVASFLLGIYLIHDNDSIRVWLWQDFLKTSSLFKNNLMVLYLFAFSISIFVACLLIDIVRKFLVEKPIILLIKKCLAAKPNI